MFTLQGRKDGFKLVLPDNFLVDEIKEKYSFILQKNKHFITRPIDFLNETIQKIQVFGFNNAALEQQQPTRAYPLRNPMRVSQNSLLNGSTAFQYRNVVPPIALTDKTLNIEFRHTLGYMNYIMLMENFIYLYTKDTRSDKMFNNINLDLFNQNGETYAKIVFQEPIINGMDMLDFDYTQPVAQSGTFKVEIKYGNFDYQFITESESSSITEISLNDKNNNKNNVLPEDVYQ